MEFVYFVDEPYSSHKNLFKEIQPLHIPEKNIYIDEDRSRFQLKTLLEHIGPDDTLYVESVSEISDTVTEIVRILGILEERHVFLYSCREIFMCDYEYVRLFTESVSMVEELLKKKSDKYILAQQEHRVGRPRKSKAVAEAIELYNLGIPVVKSARACKISASTLYRALKK